MKKHLAFVFATVLVLAFTAPLFAAVTGLFGAMVGIVPPASTLLHVLESDTQIRMFREQNDYTLPLNVDIDFAGPGLCSVNALTIPAGTLVDVYMLHDDPINTNSTSLVGGVKFDRPILGVIFTENKLDASDWLGAPGTTYPTGQIFRGLERCGSGAGSPDDMLWISPNQRRLRVEMNTSTYMEHVRVIVAVDQD